MAKLSVKLHGSEITRLNLEPGTEYIAGRAQDAQIVLPQQRGISRQHLKFYYQDGHWVCEALSKFLLIQVGDQTMEVLELNQDTIFVLTPFEFRFELEEVLETENPDEVSGPKTVANPPAIATPRFNPPPEDTRPQLNNEATMAGVSSLVPYLRITSANASDEETLKLEGHLWVAGREPSNEICLDTPHASRKHFEIVRTNEGFFVTDLGSANGTMLNGQRLAPHEPTRIESGDSLAVQNIAIVFEIRDTQFSNRVSNLPVTAPNMYQQPPPMAWPQPMHYQPEPPMEEEFTHSKFALVKKHLNWKEHKVRVIIAAILPLLLIGLLSQPSHKDKRDPAASPQTPANVSFEQMSNEQKNAIKDSFNLARNLYVQGKYELCITEVTKLHTMIPFFENSKELEEFCKQGRELVIRQKDLERKDRERAMIEQQIKEVVESCDTKLPKTANVEETRKCLMEAIELDPEHSAITEALANAQRREEERKVMDAEKEASLERATKGQQQFARAKALAQQDKLYKALKEYEDYIAKNYPNSDSNRDVARREIAAIKTQLKAKVGSKLEECKALGDKGRFKDAYLACNAAAEEDPGNSQAKEIREDMLSGLRKEMKSVYEDSVLEESMGNVDAAKEKWSKIIKENLPNDDYTVKSKGKLQKYNGN